MILKKFSIYLTTAFLSLNIISGAQDSTNPSEQSKQPTYAVTSWGDWKGEEFFAKGKDGHFKIAINDLSLSQPIPYKRSEGVILYKEVEAENLRSPKYSIAAKFSIPASIKKPLVVLLASEKDQVKYKIFELSPSGFPPGSYRFVNMTKIPVQVAIDDKLYMVKPGEDRMAKRKIKERVAINITASIADKNNQPKVVFSSAAMNRPNKRMTMFFFATKDKNGETILACKSLVDFLY